MQRTELENDNSRKDVRTSRRKRYNDDSAKTTLTQTTTTLVIEDMHSWSFTLLLPRMRILWHTSSGMGRLVCGSTVEMLSSEFCAEVLHFPIPAQLFCSSCFSNMCLAPYFSVIISPAYGGGATRNQLFSFHEYKALVVSVCGWPLFF